MDSFVVENTKWEFYTLVSGKRLLELPNIHFVIPPMVNFRLHDLVDQGWRFKVVQRGCLTSKTRPKVSIVRDGHWRGKNQNGQIKFRLPSRKLYTSLTEVFADLEKHEFEVSNIAVPLALRQDQQWVPSEHGTFQSDAEQIRVHEENLRKKWLSELDELEVIQMFNARRHEHMLELLKQAPLNTLPTDPDNVIDFVEHLKQRQSVANYDLDERVAKILR